MSFDLKNFTVAVQNEFERERAELLCGVLSKACGISLDTEPYDPAKKQISLSLCDFAFSLAPAEYGWRTEGNTLFISCGAFVGFDTVANRFASERDLSDKLFVAEGRYFDPKPHTIPMLNAQSNARIEKILNTKNTDINAIDGVRRVRVIKF